MLMYLQEDLLLDRLRYEMRLLGLRALLTPLLVIAVLALVAVILRVLNADVEHLLTAGLEIILPLAVGLLAAVTTTRDPALELQMTMPCTYLTIVLRRFAITLGWSALLALLCCCVLAESNLLVVPNEIANWSQLPQLLAEQLIWFSTLLWFAAAGFCLAARKRSVAASVSLLCGIWILSFWLTALTPQFPDWVKKAFSLFTSTLTPQIDYWLENRVLILAVAVILFLPGCLFLLGTEGLLKAAQEE